MSVKGEILEDSIEDKYFSVLFVSAEFHNAPQEDIKHVCAQVVLPLVGNFPSKVRLYHSCSMRGSIEKKKKRAEFDGENNKTFTKMMF